MPFVRRTTALTAQLMPRSNLGLDRHVAGRKALHLAGRVVRNRLGLSFAPFHVPCRSLMKILYVRLSRLLLACTSDRIAQLANRYVRLSLFLRVIPADRRTAGVDLHGGRHRVRFLLLASCRLTRSQVFQPRSYRSRMQPSRRL